MRVVATRAGRRVMMAITMVRIMQGVLDVLRTRPARLAVKGQEHQPPRIETRQQCNERADEKGKLAMRRAAGKGGFQYGILGIIAGGKEKPGQRQRAHRHQREGHRDGLTQPPIKPHVLFMVHGMDDRTGAEEQQRLEKSMGEQVEHRGAIGTRTRRKEHIAKLRTGRIGDDALDIGLHQRHRSREQRGCGTNIGDDHLCRQAGFEHW